VILKWRRKSWFGSSNLVNFGCTPGSSIPKPATGETWAHLPLDRQPKSTSAPCSSSSGT